MTTKTRSDSFEVRLTDEEREQLHDWLLTSSYAEVQKRIALPPPDGFALKISIVSLHRFFRKFSAQLRHESLLDVEGPLPPEDESRLLNATEQAAHNAAYEIATLDPSNVRFPELSRWVSRTKNFQMRQAHLDLARQKLALEQKKFEFNAARTALDHIGALKEILRDTSLDDEDKIRRARERVLAPIFRIKPDANH